MDRSSQYCWHETAISEHQRSVQGNQRRSATRAICPNVTRLFEREDLGAVVKAFCLVRPWHSLATQECRRLRQMVLQTDAAARSLRLARGLPGIVPPPAPHTAPRC